MAIIKITLTEDHLKLISHFNFGEVPDLTNEENLMPTFGLDMNNLFGGSFVLEDISYILHRYDEHIIGTECDPLGVQFPEETSAYFYELYNYILDNIKEIEELVHQFVAVGLTPGTYKCKSNEHIWVKEKEN